MPLDYSLDHKCVFMFPLESILSTDQAMHPRYPAALLTEDLMSCSSLMTVHSFLPPAVLTSPNS